MRVLTKRGEFEVFDTPYWHLVSKDSETFCNNVWVADGILGSVSAWIEAEPQIENAQTHYSFHRGSDPKEQVFERIRQEKFPHLPSRLKTFYLFESKASAEAMRNLWFPGESRQLVEARIWTRAKIHHADSRWLDGNESDWVSRAERYWLGDMTTDPRIEVIVHGAVYFPNWSSFPCRLSGKTNWE